MPGDLNPAACPAAVVGTQVPPGGLGGVFFYDENGGRSLSRFESMTGGQASCCAIGSVQVIEPRGASRGSLCVKVPGLGRLSLPQPVGATNKPAASLSALNAKNLNR